MATFIPYSGYVPGLTRGQDVLVSPSSDLNHLRYRNMVKKKKNAHVFRAINILFFLKLLETHFLNI